MRFLSEGTTISFKSIEKSAGDSSIPQPSHENLFTCVSSSSQEVKKATKSVALMMITTICFQLSSNLDAAAELNWASSSSSTSFQVGCKYDVDKDASFRVGKLLYYCAMWQHCYQESCLKYT